MLFQVKMIPNSFLGDIDISEYPLTGGFYTLGWMQQTRSDCRFITYNEWVNYKDYTWLDIKIQETLNDGKIVCIVPWDEDILAFPSDPLVKILNQYKNQPLYWIHQLPSDKENFLRFNLGFECKLLSLPWWLLNDTLTYYKFYNAKEKILPNTTQHQYLCMIGNTHSKHKYDLIRRLYEKDLHTHGLITVQKLRDYPEEVKKYAVENKNLPYQTKGTKWPKIAAQHKLNDFWISASVKNYIHIEETYDMPLILNAETTNGIFFSTEKSLWPMLLGRMYLLWGAPYIMKWIQQFHDVPQTLWSNCSFDSVGLNYTAKDHEDRLHSLIDDNRYLITHAKDLYKQLCPKLEAARWTVGPNMYKYCVKQLNDIV
jgi:hypothetical protein